MSAKLRVALLIPRTGPAGIWAPSCEVSACLAVSEINACGGILGRQIELIVADAGGTDAAAAARAGSAVDIDGAEAVVAMITSSAREAVTSELGGRVPLVYTPQFEGNVRDPNVVTIGETTAGMLGPSLQWLSEKKNAKRFFLLGNNYLWPRQSMAIAQDLIVKSGCVVVGKRFLPFDSIDHDRVLAEIALSRPDVVAMWLLGHEAVTFNRAFAEAGLAARILRFSTAIDETILYGIGDGCTENLFVASSYFSNLRSRNNDIFLERYHTSFGDMPPPPNGFGESLYEGIYCLSGLAEAAGSLRASDIYRKLGHAAQSRTARGFSRHVAAGAHHPVHIAAADGHEFRLLDTL
jgi:urea transport system substrate-binding protein